MAEKRKNRQPGLTSLRTDYNVRRYNINGRIYEFIVKKLDDGIPYGYCYKIHKWAWLHDNYIHDEDGNTVSAKLL